ncbi:type II secretion system protein N [Brevundimonas sp. 2R-24]|uniref:Type II secretion system protein N n=1 Tax=Peiella sedimenti TaxID=3061083 RepID=A0ABT8SKH1_9CAUL|nr:type II secretion system protein N [Caulobacteraceae bacterium XZ-24]
MSRLRLAVVFAAALAVWLAATLPLSHVVRAAQPERFGLSVERISGSIWSGRLHEARLLGAPLGDLNASASPWALLTGKARLKLEGERGGSAVLETNGDSVAVHDLDGAIPAGLLGLPPGLRGALDVRDGAAVFRGGACVSAAGRVRLDALTRIAGFSGPMLEGPISCQAGRLSVDMRGRTEQAEVRVNASLDAEGARQSAIQVRTADSLVQTALAAHGFQITPGGAVLTVTVR